jgi:hypothetical protein
VLWHGNRRDKWFTQVVMKVKFREGQTQEDGQRMLEEIVIPTAKSQAGFRNGVWLRDGKGSGMAVIVFATAEDAQFAQDALKPPPEGPAPELISSELHEVGGQA